MGLYRDHLRIIYLQNMRYFYSIALFLSTQRSAKTVLVDHEDALAVTQTAGWLHVCCSSRCRFVLGLDKVL